jgi:hypothetical protein
MANRVIEDISVFRAKCTYIRDVVKSFLTFSTSVISTIQGKSDASKTQPLSALQKSIATWFVLYCALIDECTYIISGDISSARHNGDKAKHQHTRTASREIYRGLWLSRCSADGIEYEVRQLPPKEQTKPVS